MTREIKAQIRQVWNELKVLDTTLALEDATRFERDISSVMFEYGKLCHLLDPEMNGMPDIWLLRARNDWTKY